MCLYIGGKRDRVQGRSEGSYVKGNRGKVQDRSCLKGNRGKIKSPICMPIYVSQTYIIIHIIFSEIIFLKKLYTVYKRFLRLYLVQKGFDMRKNGKQNAINSQIKHPRLRVHQT